jgi:DNA-binding winged helix-turn-helix (wHTH) protein/tetratricopeptide (TPR) repeat protein/TolB-like protein
MEKTSNPSRMLRFGVFEADRQLGELRRQGLQVRLQQQPFRILLILLDNAGELVSRERLRQELWPADTYVDFDHNLNKAMNRLRYVLGDTADNPRFIETLPRRGYRFIAPVIAPVSTPAVDALPATADAEIPTAAPSEPHAADNDATAVVTRQALRVPLLALLWSAIGLVLIVAIGVGIVGYRHLYPFRSGSLSSVTPRRSVAVLGFKNLSGNPSETWLSTALPDWLTTDLSAGGQLRTISAEAVSRMETELALSHVDSLGKESLSKVGKNLSTDYVVVGAYAVIGEGSAGQVRLDLRLQDTRTGETIAAVSETGTESHLFNLVSVAGGSLRAKLGIAGVTAQEASQVAVALPENHDAARLYSEGLERMRIFDAPAARDLLEKSIAIEPGYPLSHAAVASAWEQLGDDRKAEEEAKTAVQLSANLPRSDRLLVEGRYDDMSRNRDGAINVYRALFEFFPDSLDYGLALAHAQTSAGKGTEALATIELLRKLPVPLSDDPRLDLAEDWAAEELGDFRHCLNSAMKASQKARAIDASLLLAQALADEGWAYDNLGQSDDAIAAAQESRRLFAAVGYRRGVGLATNEIGITLMNKGDAAGAKAKYEESLAIRRALGNKMGIAANLDNLGDALLALGRLNESRSKYEESMAVYRELGHEDGVARVKGDLGVLLLAMGDHQLAKQNFQEALEVCSHLGDRSNAALDMAGMGSALRAEGDIEGAKKFDSQALATFEETGKRSGAALTELSLAQLLIDEGSATPAVNEARQAASEFKREKGAENEAVANAILARALLAERNVNDARSAIAEANAALSRCDCYGARLLVDITSAQVSAASDTALEYKRAAGMIERVLPQIKQMGFMNYEYEARLSLAEIELRRGNLPLAQAQLKTLEKQASAHGFGLFARQAAAILRQANGTAQK